MKYVIEIETDNDAFLPDPHLEIARILFDLVQDLEGSGRVVTGPVRDVNGNKVGGAYFTKEDDQ